MGTNRIARIWGGVGFLTGTLLHINWYLYQSGTFGNQRLVDPHSLWDLNVVLWPGSLVFLVVASGVPPFSWVLVLFALLLNGLIYATVATMAVLVYHSLLQRDLFTVGRPMSVYRQVGPGVVFFGLVFATVAFFDHRHHRMIELYQVALRGGTSQADAALGELAAFRGREATELLLDVASPRKTFPDNRQAVAVIGLTRRKDPDVAYRLADSLKPQTALALRTDISQALLNMECNSACTRCISHYLERMSWGERNVEDLLEPDPTGGYGLKAEQEQLVRTLYEVLWRNEGNMLEKLRSDYGLGTDFPSRFGLELLEVLRFKSACRDLQRSASAIFDKRLSDQVKTLIQELGCSQPILPNP